jgi:hypothetical protein
MRRREFIGATLLVASQRSQAQGTPRRIGLLASSPPSPALLEAWRSGLREKGWIEGKNLIVEYRYARPARLTSPSSCPRAFNKESSDPRGPSASTFVAKYSRTSAGTPA